MAKTRPLRKKIRTIRAKFWDVLLSPLTLIAAIWFKRIRKFGLHHMPIARAIFQHVKVLPIRDHYYEPLIIRNGLDRNYSARRRITSIDWNDKEQIELLNHLSFQHELALLPIDQTSKNEYFYQNGMFPARDSEYLYSLIRYLKPTRILEIGSGFSTLISLEATKKSWLKIILVNAVSLALSHIETNGLKNSQLN